MKALIHSETDVDTLMFEISDLLNLSARTQTELLYKEDCASDQGNGPAQRALLETVQSIEKEIAAQMAANSEAQANMPPISDLEVARRIAFILAKAAHSQERDK